MCQELGALELVANEGPPCGMKVPCMCIQDCERTACLCKYVCIEYVVFKSKDVKCLCTLHTCTEIRAG